MAYISHPDRDENTKAFKKRIYNTLHTMERAATGNREIGVVKQWPLNDWDRIWRNLHTAVITDTLKSTWYNIIHDLIPTKEQLAAIRLADSNQCDKCSKTDTLIHRLTDCTPRVSQTVPPGSHRLYPKRGHLEMDTVPPGNDPPD
jgi:hypothetical protein